MNAFVSKFPIFLLVLLPAMIGCEQTHYEIELTPREDKLERSLTYSKTNGRQRRDSDEVNAIGSIYKAEPTVVDEKFHFSKEFAERMPDDIGGHGTYKHYSTSLGDVYFYMERFRGSDDFATQLDDRRSAVNDLVDIGLDWLKVELGDKVGFDSLQQFVDQQLRHDLQNLSIYSWRLDFESDNERLEPAFRLVQFLVERDYVKVDEIASLTREVDALQQSIVANLDQFVDFRIRNLLERKLSNKKIISEMLKLFADEKRMKASLRKLDETSDRYREVKDKWDGEFEKVTGDSLLASLAFRAFWPSPGLFASGSINVAMTLSKQPDETNGEWDEDLQKVTWKRSIFDRDAHGVCDFVYAHWTVPNETFQTNQFGKAVIVQTDLVQYVLWYNGLSKNEQTQWDEFVSELDPSSDLKLKLQSHINSHSKKPFLQKGAKQLLSLLKSSTDATP